MIKVSPLNDLSEEIFKKLFTDYYSELGCDDDCKHLLDEYIMPDLLAGLIKIDMLQENGEYAGFAIYQTDGIENDWNFKEGFGDIREIYVVPSLRRRGLGKFLLYTAEMKLKEDGATQCYCLPYEKAEPFFKACGYKKTDARNDELDCPVYVKESLVNGCCGHDKT